MSFFKIKNKILPEITLSKKGVVVLKDYFLK